MATNLAYATTQPTRESIDTSTGPTLLEFGVPWCPHCQIAQPLIAAQLAQHPQVRHLKVEDGRGRPLGRSFAVKLWPTLIFLQDGKEVARLVRPTEQKEIAATWSAFAK